MKLGAGYTFDPYRACLGLAAAARSRSGILFESSRVKKVQVGAKQADVVLDAGIVHAQTVIVATASATSEYKPLRRHFKSRDSFLVLTEPMPAAMRRQLSGAGVIVRDIASPPHCIRRTKDDRLLIAGADRDETPSRQRDAVLVQRTGQLMYELLVMNPAIAGLRPEYGWESSYGETADGLMYIGPHRNYPRHLFALGGGLSSTGSFLAARILSRAVQESSEKADAVFGWTR